jgi:hypothetical protein
MSKADEMFEDLGYRIEEGKFNIFIGQGKECFHNVFVIHKNDKCITIYKQQIILDELQAINEKVKELGWLE